MILYCLLLLWLISSLTAFTPWIRCYQSTLNNQKSSLPLVPISEFRSEFTFLDKTDSYRCNIDQDGKFHSSTNDEDYILAVVSENDLPDTAQFVIQSFGADAIALSQDLNSLERALIAPSVGLLNSYSGLVAYAEVFTGLRYRTKVRSDDIQAPKLMGDLEVQVKQAEQSSLILVVAKPKIGSEWQVDIVASIELRLQLTDAKIPFTLPWLDRVERKLASLVNKDSVSPSKNLRPYLSNLCVEESHRRNNLGRSLVRCVEDVAKTVWGYDQMYLHVDIENSPALNLYKQEGYQAVKGRRWQPFWAGKAAEIGYFVKRLQ